jgi:hypothetical protein
MMPGITEPSDWALIGGVLASLAAVIKGFQAGTKDKKADPVVPTSSHTFADIELLAQAISLNTGSVAALSVKMDELITVLKAEVTRHELEDEVEQRLIIKQLADQLSSTKKAYPKSGG